MPLKTQHKNLTLPGKELFYQAKSCSIDFGKNTNTADRHNINYIERLHIISLETVLFEREAHKTKWLPHSVEHRSLKNMKISYQRFIQAAVLKHDITTR